jgi:hypothetical protein
VLVFGGGPDEPVESNGVNGSRGRVGELTSSRSPHLARQFRTLPKYLAVGHAINHVERVKALIPMDQFGRLVLPQNVRRTLNTPRTAVFEAEVLGKPAGTDPGSAGTGQAPPQGEIAGRAQARHRERCGPGGRGHPEGPAVIEFFDTTVLVAAMVEDEPHHEAGARALERADHGYASVHSLAECYATLTSGRLGLQSSPADAALLARHNVHDRLSLVGLDDE